MTEKEAIERETADRFLDLYNSQMGASFTIVKHSDAPDFYCEDKEGYELKLEITLTEDRQGDIQALVGRSDKRSPEALKRHLEAVKRGEESIFESVSCLQDNVYRMAKARIQPKLDKDYGPNTALVVRDTSGVNWSWEDVLDDLKASLDLSHNPFDRGIWLISFVSSKVFRVV